MVPIDPLSLCHAVPYVGIQHSGTCDSCAAHMARSLTCTEDHAAVSAQRMPRQRQRGKRQRIVYQGNKVLLESRTTTKMALCLLSRTTACNTRPFLSPTSASTLEPRRGGQSSALRTRRVTGDTLWIMEHRIQRLLVC